MGKPIGGVQAGTGWARAPAVPAAATAPPASHTLRLSWLSRRGSTATMAEEGDDAGRVRLTSQHMPPPKIVLDRFSKFPCTQKND